VFESLSKAEERFETLRREGCIERAEIYVPQDGAVLGRKRVMEWVDDTVPDDQED
jgi:hypothetical protein